MLLTLTKPTVIGTIFGSPGIAVVTVIRGGVLRAGARKTPPQFLSVTEIPKEPNFFQQRTIWYH